VTTEAPAVIELSSLKEMSVTELTRIAKQLEVPGATGMRKQELIFEILRARAEKSGIVLNRNKQNLKIIKKKKYTEKLN